MRVAVYAIRQGQRWRMKISLDLRIDIVWWEYVSRNAGMDGTMVLLSGDMPLGWACKAARGFVGTPDMMHWKMQQWRGWLEAVLREEWEREGLNLKGNDRKVGDGCSGMWRWELGEPLSPAVWQELMRQPEEGQWAGDVRDPGCAQGTCGAGRAAGGEAAWQVAARSGGRLAAERPGAGACRRLAQCCAAGLPSGPAGARRGRGCRRPAQRAPRRASRRPRPGPPLPPVRQRSHGPHGMRRVRPRGLRLLRGMPRAWAQPRLLAAASHSSVSGRAGHGRGVHRRRCERGIERSPGRCRLGRAGVPGGAARSAAGGRTGWMRPKWGAAQRSGTSTAPSRFLLWAVTGAGKTEMIFPLLDSVLAVGGRVLVATPRRDVVLELAPRLAKAFSGVRIVTLYGGSAERWESGALTLATTHQLMRFYHAFDLVVIDELDAFPYHNDPMLAYAAQHACKTDGKFVYLSATPPRPLQREVTRGTLPHAKVPVRYHGHPLPVPKRIAMRSVETCLRQPKLLGPLAAELRRSIDRGAQIFLFVSRIRHIGPLVEILRRRFKDTAVEGTSSEDSGRGEKVMAFRKKDIRLLVTTTILERGVTVPRSDVYILDADSSLFDEASLVQMAGRAGRSSEDPAGRVIFASSQWTLSQKLAVNQIKAMNRIAGKHGYLKEQPSKS
ncbi:helicase-related protein [Paenibacillus sp. AR247]|uniref:helicase-related protein n=1 Tax=Paenibacillus sp. AR247 TaxID=1631599 RepID=UPI0021575DD8|nr:helicase-related protein [Paenibacillus sp. AR247]